MTDTAEMIAPTAERLARARGLIDAPEVSQTKVRRSYRIMPLVEGLHARGKIEKEQLDAYLTFERDWLVGNRMPACIAAYGERVGSKADISEQTEIRKFNAARRVEQALAAIGDERSRQRMAIELVVSGGEDVDLEYVGKRCTAYTGRVPAITAGLILLQEALHRLHVHYGGT